MADENVPAGSTGGRGASRSVGWLIAVVVLLWMLSAPAISWYFPTWEERAGFGDTFGAVNALFSGLALGGVVLAVFLQRTELRLQREELTLTRSELHRTASSQEETARLAELRFLMDLAPRMEECRRDHANAWNGLRSLQSEPSDPSDPRWNIVVAALEQLNRATQFRYQLAMLANKKVIKTETLHLLYRDALRDGPDYDISQLAKRLGSTHDLAANYDWQDVLRMGRAIQDLLQELHAIDCRGGRLSTDRQVVSIDSVLARVEQTGDPYAGLDDGLAADQAQEFAAE